MRQENSLTKSWPSGARKCLRCEEVKPFSEFHKHRQCAKGYNTVCKVCRKPVSQAQWLAVDLVTKIYGRTKSRSSQRGVVFDLELSDIVVPERCPVFGRLFEYGHHDWTPSIDRVVPELGYIKGNIRIISNKANRMKSDASKEELQQFARWICEI